MKAAQLILAVLLGVFLGWLFAHAGIARECERLGGFYVGPKIFQCDRVGRPAHASPKGLL